MKCQKETQVSKSVFCGTKPTKISRQTLAENFQFAKKQASTRIELQYQNRGVTATSKEDDLITHNPQNG